MVHTARDDSHASHVEVGAQHLVPVALHASENRDTYVRLNIPQSQSVILGCG